MPRLRPLLAVFFLSYATQVAASPVCGFDIAESGSLHLRKDGECSFVVEDKINYAQLDYLIFYKNKSIDKLLSDTTFFIKSSGKYYFIQEEINDPKVTIKTLKQQAASSTLVGNMHGYIARSEHFVQVLPDWTHKSDETYSLNISCITMAAGDERQSFKTRFCTPQSPSGKKQMALYRAVIEKIRPAPETAE